MDEYYPEEQMESLEALWGSFINFLPDLLGAIIVFIIGWFLAAGIGKLVAGVLKKLNFNTFFESDSWEQAKEKADIELNVSEFIGAIVKWVIVLVVLHLSVGILGFEQFEELMGRIVSYLPNVIVAALIFIAAVIVADFLSKIMVASAEKADFVHTNLMGAIVKWAIWLFAIFAILIELGIADEMFNTLFEGLVYMIAIAGGLAFGLGGRDAAKEAITKVKDNIEK